ncbi:OsmC family protein [Armatimonas sp.]|uniref:OsmC family protein n=1 Tax=Armatimonas sp. TaxID=1872638 RepID=UPI00286A44D3|nr:OsmC family protein [Armatimonas sp.]
MSTVKISIVRVGPCAYDASDALGNTMRLAGSAEFDQQIRERLPDPSVFPETLPSLENSGPGFRPMALLLISLAGCSALDLGLILARQRQDVRGLTIEAEGTRVEATPAPYTHITLTFTAHGPVDPAALERAAELAVRRYCSVADSLDPKIEVTVLSLVSP